MFSGTLWYFFPSNIFDPWLTESIDVESMEAEPTVLKTKKRLDFVTNILGKIEEEMVKRGDDIYRMAKFLGSITVSQKKILKIQKSLTVQTYHLEIYR